MNIKIKLQLQKLVIFFIGTLGGGIVGWGITNYMDRPDISYYAKLNQHATVRTENSKRILTSWYRTRRNLKRGEIYSSSVYLRNTGNHAYKGEDFSKGKNPLRIESDKPITLFTINDKQNPETTVSITDKNGIYYIDFDFINYGKSINFVFIHSQPVKYIQVKGAGVNFPSIKEKIPFTIWMYTHPLWTLISFLLLALLLIYWVDYTYSTKIEQEHNKQLAELVKLQNELKSRAKKHAKK